MIPGNLGIIFTGDTQYPLNESGVELIIGEQFSCTADVTMVGICFKYWMTKGTVTRGPPAFLGMNYMLAHHIVVKHKLYEHYVTVHNVLYF